MHSNCLIVYFTTFEKELHLNLRIKQDFQSVDGFTRSTLYVNLVRI